MLSAMRSIAWEDRIGMDGCCIGPWVLDESGGGDFWDESTDTPADLDRGQKGLFLVWRGAWLGGDLCKHLGGICDGCVDMDTVVDVQTEGACDYGQPVSHVQKFCYVAFHVRYVLESMRNNGNGVDTVFRTLQ